MKVRYFMAPPRVSSYSTNEPGRDRHASCFFPPINHRGPDSPILTLKSGGERPLSLSSDAARVDQSDSGAPDARETSMDRCPGRCASCDTPRQYTIAI